MEDSKTELGNAKGKVSRREISETRNNGESEPFSKADVEGEALFDSLMEEIGNDGKFQKRFNFIYNFVFVLLFSMSYLNIILAMTIPEHWCHVPGRNSTNFTLHEWKEKWLPKDKEDENWSFNSCKMYENDTSQAIVDCQHGWDFDRQWYTETVPSEESWVCDKEIFVSNSFAAGRVGDIVGSFVAGQFGDRFGRKPIFHILTLILVIGRVLTVFTSKYYYIFLFSIALGNTSSTSVFQSPLIISMEISAEKKRSYIAFLQCFAWVVGCCILALLAWILKDWKQIVLLTTFLSGLSLFMYKLVPESPRWLANRGKLEEAVDALTYIARVNNTRIPRNTYSVLEKIGRKKEKFYGLATLFVNWRLTKHTIIIIICWTVSNLCYFVLTLNVTVMSGNPFMNFFWQSLVEFPGYVIGKILSDRIGRRWTQTTSYIFGAVFCIMAILAQTTMGEEFVIFFAALVKFALTISFYMVWLQAMEIYPTCVRQTGSSAGGMVSNLVCITGPYIVLLGSSIDARLPYAILLVTILLGGITSSFLPETLNKKLPETLDDAKVFGKNQKYWSFPLANKN